ncbi:hypothetical protein LWI29_033599 [Acer saccharum]|uniref:Uncharacterized protein n=1 Tax=Acer saccharum TaxID=4024 RepID=A0AA39TJH1_ACESA|nr:hypothetical protein LWI29_033599 [Acer saccharum]
MQDADVVMYVEVEVEMVDTDISDQPFDVDIVDLAWTTWRPKTSDVEIENFNLLIIGWLVVEPFQMECDVVMGGDQADQPSEGINSFS